jgi:hypothetical protein
MVDSGLRCRDDRAGAVPDLRERLHPMTRRRTLTMRRSKYVISLIAVLALLVAGGASAFVISHASSKMVQPQPPPGSCHMSGQSPFNTPDAHCTPGALNAAVRQATIGKTICRSGYSTSIRPSTSVTEPEKLASMRAYGLHRGPSSYEYDHLISLELGGAANDSRNLWPEPGGLPNPKDKVEDYLHTRVCDRRMTLAFAQRVIALHWVTFYNRHVKPPPPPPPTTTTTPPPPPPPPTTGCYPKTSSGNCYEAGEYCPSADHGMTGVAGNGEPIICTYNSGWRWEPN